MGKAKKIIHYMILGCLLISCGQASLWDATSQIKARVSPLQAHEAYKIIDQIDYLPFNYKLDGCYARALYMSMELAAAQIPSSSVFMFGKLHPTKEITWGFHVAPFIVVSEKPLKNQKYFSIVFSDAADFKQVPFEIEPTVIDPSMADGPESLGEWVKGNNPESGIETAVVLTPAYFYEEGLPWKYLDKLGIEARKIMPQTFSDLHPFSIVDIEKAKNIMAVYIALENESGARKVAKVLELFSRTDYLVERLKELGKISD